MKSTEPRSIFKLLTLKETLVGGLGSFFHRMISKAGYFDTYIPTKNEIVQLVNQGYQVSRSGKSISISGRDFFRNYQFLLRPLSSDRLVYTQVIEQLEYQPLIALIENYTTPETINTIVDAGSNVGFATMYFAQCFPNARIITIEPDSGNFRQLKKNLEINSLLGRTKLIAGALWENNSDVLEISNEFRNGQEWAKMMHRSEEKNNASINAFTLNDIITSNNIPVIDVLKIDIEGSERFLFTNPDFASALADKVKFLAIEIHDEFNCREGIEKVLRVNGIEFKRVGETTFCVNRKFYP